jgi:hypothetical protein
VSYDLYFWKTAAPGSEPADIADALADGETGALTADASLLEFQRAMRQRIPDAARGVLEPDLNDPEAGKYAIATMPIGAVARYVTDLVEIGLTHGLTIYDPQLDEVVTEVPARVSDEVAGEPLNIVPMPGATSLDCPRCSACIEIGTPTENFGPMPVFSTRCGGCGAPVRVMLPPVLQR